MIKTVTYQESNGRKPYADWLDGLTDNKAKARILMRVKP
jgi:putative component of toxin-antitoxin plasmid stabilization module